MQRSGRPVRSTAVALVLAMGAACAAASDFDRTPWVEDFLQLERELAFAYANLDWSAQVRRMDLPAMAGRAREQLGRAASTEEARQVFERFLREFGDGHLQLVWNAAPATAAAAPEKPAAEAVARSCADLGYRAPRENGLDFSTHPRFRPLPNAPSASFPAGILQTARGTRVGIVRIGLLMEKAFPAACEIIHPAASPCDKACEERIDKAVGERISADLAAQLRALASGGAAAIAIDLTLNGGGSDWAEAAARIVTAPGLKAPRMAFIRHPHWVAQFRERLADVETDLGRDNLAPAARTALVQARGHLEKAIRVASESCDRAGVWDGRKTCPLVADDPVFRSTGILEVKPAFGLAGLEADHVLYNLGRYGGIEGAWRGRLAVLVDGGTASAAELFAATLKDNGRATIIGSLTFGSGCGYTNGGIAIRLARSGALLRVPDCVRYRADGSNEVAGIVPDILVPWRGSLSRAQRTAHVVPALERWADATRP